MTRLTRLPEESRSAREAAADRASTDGGLKVFVPSVATSRSGAAALPASWNIYGEFAPR